MKFTDEQVERAAAYIWKTRWMISEAEATTIARRVLEAAFAEPERDA